MASSSSRVRQRSVKREEEGETVGPGASSNRAVDHDRCVPWLRGGADRHARRLASAPGPIGQSQNTRARALAGNDVAQRRVARSQPLEPHHSPPGRFHLAPRDNHLRDRARLQNNGTNTSVCCDGHPWATGYACLRPHRLRATSLLNAVQMRHTEKQA
ncbi:hypothetical protein BDY21DRAFT_174562 [Lineolata rhizophorae]|uniref:Uncharacterized protein n=1 Tax=Lineolata rhizophorae TaxID=578093 RepID=A0A6A6NKW9_9PEZI|nr:hypothetical protein BDY21DRAFT_174562 [Lineolata rhizophorae]